jgi:hypothetical protein
VFVRRIDLGLRNRQRRPNELLHLSHGHHQGRLLPRMQQHDGLHAVSGHVLPNDHGRIGLQLLDVG